MPKKEELYEQAQDLDIEGRSDMNKAELEDAIAEAGGDVEESKDEEVQDFSGVDPLSVSASLADNGGLLPADGKINAPMEDPVGTMVTHREELADQVAGDEEAREEARAARVEAEAESEDLTDAEKAAREQFGLSGVTTTGNGERAASGDPEVTWANIHAARAAAGVPVPVEEDEE